MPLLTLWVSVACYRENLYLYRLKEEGTYFVESEMTGHEIWLHSVSSQTNKTRFYWKYSAFSWDKILRSIVLKILRHFYFGVSEKVSHAEFVPRDNRVNARAAWGCSDEEMWAAVTANCDLSALKCTSDKRSVAVFPLETSWPYSWRYNLRMYSIICLGRLIDHRAVTGFKIVRK